MDLYYGVSRRRRKMKPGENKLTKESYEEKKRDKNFRDLIGRTKSGSWLDLANLRIYSRYGIDLTWTEKSALRQYLQSNESRREKDHSFDWFEEGINHFMREYFDIETTELERKGRYLIFPDRKAKVVEVGNGFAGTREFKQYCQERVQMWRDERNLV